MIASFFFIYLSFSLSLFVVSENQTFTIRDILLFSTVTESSIGAFASHTHVCNYIVHVCGVVSVSSCGFGRIRLPHSYPIQTLSHTTNMTICFCSLFYCSIYIHLHTAYVDIHRNEWRKKKRQQLLHASLSIRQTYISISANMAAATAKQWQRRRKCRKWFDENTIFDCSITEVCQKTKLKM